MASMSMSIAKTLQTTRSSRTTTAADASSSMGVRRHAGGGIIGCSIAYHLTLLQPATRVTIIERFGIASCASGKAGGFLAGGWGDSVTDELHTKSFAMHAQLAKTLGLKSYRKIPTLQVGVGGRGNVAV